MNSENLWKDILSMVISICVMVFIIGVLFSWGYYSGAEETKKPLYNLLKTKGYLTEVCNKPYVEIAKDNTIEGLCDTYMKDKDNLIGKELIKDNELSTGQRTKKDPPRDRKRDKQTH